MSNNLNDCDIPESDFLNDEIILGIDEAGRGPVLGPMVYACAYYSVKNEDEIKKYFKVDDSKKLTDQMREKIFEKMCNNRKIIEFQAEVIHPQLLSNEMLSRNKTSLNKISMDTAIKLIRDTLNKGVNVKQVRVDTVGPAEKYKQLLEKEFSLKIEFIVCPKADSLYPSVSAASIVAKVTRDRTVDNWEFVEDKEGNLFNNNFGCGYPSDPKTKIWLSEHADAVFGYPNMVRFSWKTTSNQLKDKIYKITFEDYVEDDENNTRKQFLPKQEKIENSFNNKSSNFSYLEENKIKINNFNI